MQESLELGGTRRKPLADRIRPAVWEDLQGAEKIDRNLLQQMKEGRGRPPSLILWGPPGVGKTTLAKLICRSYRLPSVEFSAVLSGVKEVREVVAQAKRTPNPTILFVDEIHRFNKGQQDAFLPHVEDGTIILIGATTENPSFYLTSALLSRCKVIQLHDLERSSLDHILARAATEVGLSFAPEAADALCSFAGGDGRKLLNLVEAFAESWGPKIPEGVAVTRDQISAFLSDAKNLFYDRSGEEHYNLASAFIKSMRGSDPDAALYWGFRMIEGGEDPRFIIRRMMIFASEDIGNADPRALQVAVATSDAYEKLGLPEGRIPIAQCITYLASAPKSNRSYIAMHAVLELINKHPKAPVPLHIRNAPTSLMKELSYGKDYQYPHDAADGYAPGVQYLPDIAKGERFYHPTDRGYEKTLSERLAYVRGRIP